MTRMITPTGTSGARAGQRSQERRPDTADVYLLARQLQAKAMADATASVLHAIARPLAGALKPLVARFSDLRARQRTLNELSHLDARTLQDIGVDPHNIEAAVDQLFSKRPQPQPAHDSLSDVIRNVDHMIAAVRRWDTSRRAANQMARMSRETLADLGYVKGDVDWVPERLAERNLHANRNADRSKAA